MSGDESNHSENIGDEMMQMESRRRSSRERGSRYQDKHRGGSGGAKDRRKGRNESRERTKRRDYRSPNFNDHFMLSFKDFCAQQRPGLSRDELQDLFDQYKQDYEIFHAEIFFKEHREDCWFRERYDPETAYQWEIEKRLQSNELA